MGLTSEDQGVVSSMCSKRFLQLQTKHTAYTIWRSSDFIGKCTVPDELNHVSEQRYEIFLPEECKVLQILIFTYIRSQLS